MVVLRVSDPLICAKSLIMSLAKNGASAPRVASPSRLIELSTERSSSLMTSLNQSSMLASSLGSTLCPSRRSSYSTFLITIR